MVEFNARMRATSWHCLVLVSFVATITVHVQGQTDSLGFISIDCGLPENTSYIDNSTKISYVSDSGFVDTGVNRNISVAYIYPKLSRRYWNVRSFPDGARNCYTLKSLTFGLKYLLRATFYYGNYDGLNKPPVFDIYLGVNLWATVNMSEPDSFTVLEIIAFSPDNFLQVCLVNKKLGAPFISGLDLRPLKTSLYPEANATQSLALLSRHNMGPTDATAIVRYPDDSHDRIWVPFDILPEWRQISTTSLVKNLAGDLFDVPSAVMQTAITPVNSSQIDFTWDLDPNVPPNINNFFIVLYFSELQATPVNTLREFNIILNKELFYKKPFTPDVLYSDVVYGTARGYRGYNLTLNATEKSTFPPIFNAVEVYTIVPATEMVTDSSDVTAITAIKAGYQVKRNWNGDPCVPKAFAWDGLNCSYAVTRPPRITTLKLSSSGLSGVVIPSFADLKALQYLDLSGNDLSGSIPDFLEQLPSLVFLDLSGNKLNWTVPAGLLKRSQEGSLTLRIGGNCASCGSTKKKNSIPVVAVIVPVIVVVLLLVVILVVKFVPIKKNWKVSSVQANRNGSNFTNPEGSSLQFENRQFTHGELKLITNDYRNEIGKGGFGSVYVGQLENGTPVAVKVRNQSSSQGIKEFIAEAQSLTRVHHKNLVSMIGYCNDGNCLALVYEFMSGGTLQGRLRGRASSDRPLAWLQRLRVALESAQGLEYLHKSCKPPLIHRDVKTANILLAENLEAKIADFGLSKAFDADKTHVSTQVVGTPGYLDPEYYSTYQLSEKSDVFSFGVVLLEVVTGQPPILEASENGHIVQWVRQRLARGNIESITDPKMRGQYDVNSVWKVADVALKCTAQSSSQRPTMADVVMQLKESLELAMASETGYDSYPGSTSQYSRSNYLHGETSDYSQNSAFETEHLGDMAENLGPGAR